jgi:membrane-bound serine protease (ClpP class)
VRSPILISLLLIGLAAFAFGAEQSPAPAAAPAHDAAVATVLDIKGPIGPATSRFVQKSLQAAQAQNSRLVVLQIDTPGGLDTAMRDIIRDILASRIPVAAYVTPSGARAASAGAYILYASHIAAMAPATNVGAATPVSIGGEPERDRSPPRDEPANSRDEPNDSRDTAAASARDTTPPRPGRERTARDTAPAQRDEPTSARNEQTASRPTGTPATRDASPSKREGEQPPSTRPQFPEPGTAMERKVINDAVAYIRGLAELRGRNADWAEAAVRGGVSLPATTALQQHVIDYIARDLPDLFTQIDGKQIKVAERTITLNTKALTVQRIEPDWRTQLLSVLTNPTIAYGLLLIGIYGLLLEGYNPGAVLPGVVGAISLLTALFAFQILSVNYAGLALVALGIGMIIAEFFVPSFGSLGLGGLVSFVVGSIILLDTDVPGLDIATPVIAGIATAGGLVIFGIAFVASRSMRKPAVTGTQTMIGQTAEVLDGFDQEGLVRIGGELWKAHTSAPLRAGQHVRVAKVQGLSVWVEPV